MWLVHALCVRRAKKRWHIGLPAPLPPQSCLFYLSSYSRKQFHLDVNIMVIPSMSLSQAHHQNSHRSGHICWTAVTHQTEDNSQGELNELLERELPCREDEVRQSWPSNKALIIARSDTSEYIMVPIVWILYQPLKLKISCGSSGMWILYHVNLTM